jgi:Zn-dependent M28 family amino/carboxypeptidase
VTPRRAVALASILAAAGWLGCRRERAADAVPPSLQPAALLADVTYLASDELEGRLAGSAGGAAARAFVLERFRDLGLEPAFDGFLRPFRFERGGSWVEGVNAVATLRGTDPSLADRWLVVSAHYDHLGVHDGEIFNGADDNASGVAVLLGLAATLAEAPLRRPVLFAAFDAEESGQWGARAFVAEPPAPLDHIAAAVNLDMLGRGDGGALWASGTRHTPSLRPPLERAARGAAIPLRFGHDAPDQPEDWTLSSDHAAFHTAGIPFVYFGVEDHPDYHRPSDDAASIDAAFLSAAGALVLRALHELDAALPPAAAKAS